MTKLYLTKTIPNKDKKIELTYEFSTNSQGRKLEDMESIVKKFNEAVVTFEKTEIPGTARATPVPTDDEKLIHSIQVIFRNARDKMYEDNLVPTLQNWNIISDVETKIIHRIIYG